MGFVKHALIGIALYEVVKYFLKKEDCALNIVSERIQVIPPDLQRMPSQDSADDLIAGSNPETPLAGRSPRNVDDPWKNSLANDELRAPDS